MSLAVLANHMASKGRNGDSMLVHMSPEEVRGLHALALMHGEKLTINPETGLPEAFSLKSLLPMIAGMALNAFLPGVGTAVSSALGITGAAAGAIGTGLTVGAVTGLATGSLQKGIMAGLGAYGGATLGGGLEAAGMAAAQQAAMSPEAIAQITGPELVGNATAEAVARNQLAEQATRDYLAKGAFDRFTGGVGALGTEAGRTAALQGVGGASGLMRAGFAAAAPYMADAMVPTTTPMPSGGGYQYNPRIRPMAYDPYTGTLQQLPMFSAINRGQAAPVPTPAPAPQTPGGYNGGGIVALANGGPSLPSDIGNYTAQQKGELYNQFLNQGFTDAQIRAAAGQQSDADWQALQSIAAGLRPATPPAAAPVAAPVAVPAASPTGGLPALALPSDVATFNPQQKGALYNQYLDKGYSDAAIRAAAGQQTDTDWQGLQAIAAQQRIQLPSDVTSRTAQQKADLYNQYLSQGITDAQIRAAAGQQTDADWMTLQQLAAQANPASVSGAERTVLTNPNWTSVTGQSGIAGLNANIRNWVDTNRSVTIDQINAEANRYGVDDQDILRALQATGGSKALQTVMTQDDWRSREGVTGTLGLNRNIQLWFQDNPNFTEKQVRDEMNKWGLNDADIVRAMGLGVNDLVKYISKAGAPAPAPAGGGKDTNTIVGGAGNDTIVGGGGKDTKLPVTNTTPTFTLPTNQQVITTPTGTITGGTVTGAVDTRAALDAYANKSPYVQPVSVTSAGVVPGYRGLDTIYGGTDRLKQLENAPLGTPGKVSVGKETMQEVRDAYTRGGGRLGMPTITTPAPTVTGASKAAYDYLMGQGAYPVNQVLPDNAPLMLPYLQASGIADQGRFFGRKTIPTTPTRETALTAGGGSGNTVTWRNVITGETRVGTPTAYITDPQWQQVDAGVQARAGGGLSRNELMGIEGAAAQGGNVQQYNLGGYSDGGRLLRGPGDGVSDSIPATIGNRQPARLADGEFVIPARIVSEIGNGSTEAGARKLYAMMDRVQRARAKTTGKGKVAKNTRADKYLPA